jgi:hypothetical protein
VGDQEMEISLAERWDEGSELIGVGTAVGTATPERPEGGGQ